MMNGLIQDASCRQGNPKSSIRNSKDGFTIIELIVVVAITSILLAFAGLELAGWFTNYKIESAAKNMYVDLMNARSRAVQRNRVYFVVLTGSQYTIYEDTNPAPDGNNILETASDTMVLQKNSEYTMNYTAALASFSFDKNGYASNNGTINLVSTASPDYDCIVVFYTRINLGQYSGGNCNVK